MTSDQPRKHGSQAINTIDLLLRSVVDCESLKTIDMVLSGALDNGSRGRAAIPHAVGQPMVLRPSAAVSYGMPENAIVFEGSVTVIGSCAHLASKIRGRVAFT